MRASGFVYFVDPRGLPRLLMADLSVARCFRKLHGLPLNPGLRRFAPEETRFSTDVPVVLHELYAQARALTGGGVTFMHKGGPEGEWARAALPDVSIIDLEEWGCPRADELPPVPGSACPFHSGKKKDSHCPRAEVARFAEWLKRPPPP